MVEIREKMNDSRTVNTTRNVIWGTVYKVVAIFFPFIIKTIVLYTLGTEYLGLNGLFRSILTILNIADLGIGSALIYSMYKPMAENDMDTISILLKFYRNCYRVIGLIVLVIGLVILPFIERLVEGDYPAGLNLYILYGIYLFDSVLSYFLFSYKRSLLTACQRGDIQSKINIITHLLLYFLQILFLVTMHNYYIYLVMMPLTTALTNILYAIVTHKRFPNVRCHGVMPREQIRDLKKRVVGLMFNRIGRVVLTSVDSVVISAFLGLIPLAMYGNYYYIIYAIIGIFTMIINAMIPSIGNSIIKESVKKNYENFKQFTFMYSWIVTWCATCFLCLAQQFMKMWMGEKLLLPVHTIFIFAIYLYIWGTNDMSNAFKSALGLWWEGRFIPLIASVINVGLNLALVKIIKIDGILVSTIATFIFVYIPWSSYILFRYYFNDIKQWANYLLTQIRYFIVFCFVSGVTFLLCSKFGDNGIGTFILKILFCVVFPNAILFLCYCREDNFKRSFNMIRDYITKKCKKKYKA